MPLNIVGQTTPVPVGVQALPIGGPAMAVAQAPAVTPQIIGVSAQQMSPTVFAGFTLAKFVLGITSGSIALLFVYLLVMDWVIGSDVRKAYQKAVNPNQAGAELLIVSELGKFLTDLGDARKNPSTQWTAESLQNAQRILKEVDQLPSVTSEQKAKLQSCVPPPAASDTTRNNTLDACLALAGGLKQNALDAAAAAADAKVAADSAGKIGDQRQSLHLFWVQAAQLVLLNLLLPLLTALFGYIFGTQQAQKT